MTLTVVLLSILVLFCGCFIAATPWLMPPTECFAVTIPPSAQHDPRIMAYRRTYALVTGLVSAVCALGMAFMLPQILGDNPTEGSELTASNIIVAATLVPIIAGAGLMLYYRSRVRAIKQEEGWAATAQQATAVVSEDIPKPISLAWNLLYVVPTLAMVVFALAMYDRFPAEIPMNSDFSGNVTIYADKSVGSVLFPAITAGYLGLIFTLCHWFTRISKRPVDPAAPTTSAMAYGRFARVQSQIMLIGGLLLSTSIGLSFYLAALDIVSLAMAGIVMMVVTILFAIAMAGVSIWLGQSGARMASELRPNDELAQDDDAHWILGTFYFNPDDPSIIIPKRFGFGWSINHARPAAWLMIAAIVLITIVFAVVSTKLGS